VSLHTQKDSYEKLSQKNKLIFLAGVFDGEGSSGIWSSGRGRSRRFGMTVETSDKDMVKRFHTMFGGSFFLCPARQKHHKDTWRWRIVGDRAYECMDKMISYMCLRRQEKYNVDTSNITSK
jgi:hypothetical protein